MIYRLGFQTTTGGRLKAQRTKKMDILTERGQVSLEDEQYFARWFKQQFSLNYTQTPKDYPAAVDAIISNEGSNKLMAVAETKCRYDLTLDQFQTSFNNEWLVTWAKVQKVIEIANALGVPSVGFLYLVKPKVVLMQRFSEPDGRLMAPIKLATTKTQATINGGEIYRTNAYIDMKDAFIYKVENENNS